MIGVWLSQAGLLYPLSADCFGMFEDSVIFPAFVLVVIILLGARTFRVCNSTQFLGNADLMERHVVFIFCFNVKHSESCLCFCLFLLKSLLNSSVATVTLVLFCSNDLWQLVCTGTLLFRSWQVSCSH